MKVKAYYPFDLQMDNPETGQLEPIKTRVKRFTVEEAVQFRKAYNQTVAPPSDKMVARNDSVEEQAVNEKNEFVIGEQVIRTRRLQEMSQSDRATYDRMTEEEERFAQDFVVGVIRQFVAFEDKQLELEDGSSITTGEQFLAVYGGRSDLLQTLLKAVHYENMLSVPVKKALRSLSDSARSLAASKLAAIGQKQGPTATSASSEVSVSPADAVDPAILQSGSAE